MHKALAITSAIVLSIPALAHAEVSVRPIALQIGSPQIEAMDFSFQPNGINAGTSVHLLVSGLEQSIVQLDDVNSKLDKAVDSTGKDLLQERPMSGSEFSFSSGPIGSFPKVSEDGSRLIVVLIAPQTPAPGATDITYEAELSVMVATGRKTVSAQGVALTPAQVQLGDHTIQIADFGPSDWEEGKFKLTIKMNTDLLDAIAAWKVTDPDGQLLSEGPNSTMTMNTSAELELTLDAKPDSVDIELELYDGMQRIAIPITTRVGLGIE
jgi:hypothetical protein